MEEPHPLISYGTLRDRGWTSDTIVAAVEKRSLDRVTRGEYALPAKLSGADAHLRLARAVLERQGPGTVLSHATAALVHGIPVAATPARVHVTREPPSRGRRTAELHVHVARLGTDATTVAGLPVTSLARTAADLSRSTSYPWGVVAADAALRLGATPDDLAAQVVAARHRTNRQRLALVARFADGKSESPAESLSRVSMARAGIPAPELQYRLEVGGRIVARGDFGWPALGVIGEMDGRSKFGPLRKEDTSSMDVAMALVRRDESIRQAGMWPCHWGWTEANSPALLGRLLRGAFQAAAAKGLGG